jgi:hypothetical protein
MRVNHHVPISAKRAGDKLQGAHFLLLEWADERRSDSSALNCNLAKKNQGKIAL